MSEIDLRVCVIGAGTMGHGVAQVAAMAGYRTVLVDIDPQRLQSASQRIVLNLDRGIARGKVTSADKHRTMALLRTDTRLQRAAADADLVVEAVPELPDLKRQVLASACTAAPPSAILATNTSSLPLSSLVDAIRAPQRFIGLHFFNPVHIQTLLEVVVTPQTSQAALHSCLAFGQALGKECIVVRDSPGFATSRLGVALGLEAIRMLQEGVASAEDIDKAMALGYRHPMGPLRLTDLVGLDVRLNIAETLAREIDPVRFDPPRLLREMVARGRLGRKTGAGFYEYL